MRFFIFLFCLMFSSFFLINFIQADSSEKLDVSIQVVDKIETGDIVEINNNEFQNQEAEVISVDKIQKEALVSLLSFENSEPVAIPLENLKIVKKSEGGLLQTGNGNWNMLYFLILIAVAFLFALIFRKNKKKKTRKKAKKAKNILKKKSFHR
jgi:hypothetical protein